MVARLFIVNPACGNGATGRRWAKIQNVGGDDAVVLTNRAGQALELASEAAAAGVRAVVAVGGDGTVNEVANGLMTVPRERRPALGIVPAGTGNDFARCLGIPRRWKHALALLNDGKLRPVDLGCVQGAWGDRYFAVAAFAGAAAVMADSANKNGKSLRGIGGYLRYLPAALRYETLVMVDADSQSWTGMARSIQVANVSTGGGGVRVSPEAVPDDGLLNVMLIEAGGVVQTARLLMRLATGRHINLPEVHHRATREASFDGHGLLVAVDGDIVGPCPAHTSVVPNALNVIVPRWPS